MFFARILRQGAPAPAIVDGEYVRPLRPDPAIGTLRELLDQSDPLGAARDLVESEMAPLAKVAFLPPIDDQEVWAAGVTYYRSRTARMEESQGAERFYDLVYEAPRPELFFKGSPHRVVGPGGKIRIRRDSNWNVPEPELTLAINSRLELVGFTAGNDVSSRDIEGENPLYLPQAKVYDASCALGPWITPVASMPPLAKVNISLEVDREGMVAFQGSVSLSQMRRSCDELISFLGRDNSFPSGAFLMTGTGIVPDASFSLLPGDEVSIRIDGIGELKNRVVQG